MIFPDEPILTPNLTAEEETAIAARGQTLANHLAIFLKTAKIYEPQNDNFCRQRELLWTQTESILTEQGELSLQFRSGYLFFSGVRLRSEQEQGNNIEYLCSLFQNLGISGFAVQQGLSRGQLHRFTQLCLEQEARKTPDFGLFQKRLEEEDIESIGILPPVVETKADEDEVLLRRRFAQQTFFAAISNLRTVVHSINAGKSVGLARTTRIIHSLVDQVLADDSYLLELTALKQHDEYTFLHSTNVCIYSICLGANLNLSKVELARLGFAALFHDIGKTHLPLELLNKPAEFKADEWELMRKHPVYGILTIAKTMPFDEAGCRAMLVAFEHHFNLDGTGYPDVGFRRQPHLYSRVVAICDVFDALTSGRVYRRDPVSPEQVLRKMLEQAGEKFDEHLLKAFIRTVSVYPPGTLLLLDDEHLALSIARNQHDLFRPRAKIVGSTRCLFEIAEEIDLSERIPVSGEYRRQIVRVIEPSELRLDISPYILESWRNR